MRPKISQCCAVAWVLILTISYPTEDFACAWRSGEGGHSFTQSVSKQAETATRSNAQEWFAKGQAALESGNLSEAEKAFRQVIALDPGAGAAYSNLGVVAMRRKEWDRAIAFLRQAEKLKPRMSGIRLNIGLVEYRRGNYAAAIAPLASVLRDQPDSQQARYLLGLCQVFSKRYAEGVKTLEPLWSEKSSDVLYLYVLDIAAAESGQKELDEKILSRMVAVGGGSPEFHLIMGKSHLNRGEVPEAISELEQAARLNPELPFVHFNLGIAYFRSGDYDRAEAEFRSDIALEPDLAENYNQLGVLYSRAQKDEQAEKAFREALARDSKMAGAYTELARLYQRQQKFAEALKMIDAALRLSPDISRGHYLRGRILMQLGRSKEGQAELTLAQKALQSQLGKERQAREQNRVPNPELTQQP